ncbi:MAG: GNAT family N-acetyltransferase [Alphaproteobacteria bacterium]
MTAVDIRPAGEDDIPELIDVGVGAWRGAHTGVLSAHALETGPETLAEEIREGWQDMFVAETGGHIVGFFSFVPGTGHIRHIYVHRDRLRQGIGSLMMTAALDILRERGFLEATIDVVEGTDGDAFNRALGWRETGRERNSDGAVIISMRRAL